MKQRAEAVALRGGKTSATSLTPRRANLVAADARALTLCLLLDAGLGSVVSSRGFLRFLFPFLRVNGGGPEATSRSESKGRLGGSSGKSSMTYC